MQEQILMFYDFSKSDYLQIRPRNGTAPITPGLKEIVLCPLSRVGLDDQHYYMLHVTNLSRIPKYAEDGKLAPEANQSFLFSPSNGQDSIKINLVPGVYFLRVSAFPYISADWGGICYHTRGASMVVI